jgi:hypothetical protein
MKNVASCKESDVSIFEDITCVITKNQNHGLLATYLGSVSLRGS